MTGLTSAGSAHPWDALTLSVGARLNQLGYATSLGLAFLLFLMSVFFPFLLPHWSESI
jgi:hypothetical protein